MPSRLLIVDDEPHIRTVMRLALEDAGYEVSEAGSGEEALELLAAAARCDLMLLDERMPGIDGLETLRRLRARDPDVAVIMVTAYASIELAVEAMKLGATDFVRKPMSPDTIRSAVDAALRKARGHWPTLPSASRSLVEVGVLNGFRVVHDVDGSTPVEHRFEVARREPPVTRRVLVRFSDDVVAAASEEAGRALNAEPAFWREQGALALAHYIWTHAGPPPEDQLIVTQLTRDIVKAARARLCWKLACVIFAL
jgi:DNA-binding response OmpR family regulator